MRKGRPPAKAPPVGGPKIGVVYEEYDLFLFGEDTMILSAFTLFHVVLSLVGIGSGFVVLSGMLHSKQLEGWTRLFLVTTAATSVTGFLFPFHGVTPGIVVGI